VKRLVYVLLGAVVTIVILLYSYLNYTSERDEAVPGESALAMLAAPGSVTVEQDDWLVMRPRDASPARGIIFYPGANCDIRGYAELMQAMAEAGNLVVGVPMPFNLAILNPYAADAVQDEYPEISSWVIAGHSLGGAMAGMYTSENEAKLDGLILFDSYPPESNTLADAKLPVLHLHRARLDGSRPQMFIDMEHVYPADMTTWVGIPGGIHMYFGSFVGGPYEEEWEPEISNAEQIRQTQAALKSWLNTLPQ